MALPDVQRVTHFNNWVVAHAHVGVFGFAAMISLGGIYYILPRAIGKPIFSRFLADLQYWLVLTGVIGFTVVLTTVYAVITVYDNTITYGRMHETPAIRPYEKPVPAMAAGVVPFRQDGEAEFRLARAEEIKSPLDLSDPATVEQGKKVYKFYCFQCHGGNYDGKGTVGQSFHPLPGNLQSARVQNALEGALFQEISYSIEGGRQPALATTMTMEERWQVIAYVKSLGIRE